MDRRRLLAASFPLGWPLALRAATEWPSRPLRLIVVYPPGGVSDLAARALADTLAPALGVPVLLEHRPGAGGGVGMEHLARAAPDGHTLAFSAVTPLTLWPLVSRGAPDLLDAVEPVGSVMRTPVLVAGTPAFRGANLADLIETARLRPGSMRWATSGIATTGHLVLVQVRLHAQVAITHVPYKGGGQQINDALAAQFEVLSTNVGPLQLSHVAAGRLRALAVGAPARLPLLPGVPTLAELGHPDANLASHFGLFAPRGVAPAVMLRVRTAVRRALASRAVTASMARAHLLPSSTDPSTFARQIAEERRRHVCLVARAGDAFG